MDILPSHPANKNVTTKTADTKKKWTIYQVGWACMEERREANILTIWELGFCDSKAKKGRFCGTSTWYVLLLFFCWSVFYVCQKRQSVRCKILCPYIMKEVKQSNPSIQWLMFNLLSPLDLCISASPALLRNRELSHPQEIQQTLNCRNKKSYWAFGKCSEQHCPSPPAKCCSRDRHTTGGNDWQRDVAKCMWL